MKKTTIITALLALATITVHGQELKMNEPSVSDYLPLLKVKGYMAYSFDTNMFKGKQVEPIIKEYADGKEVGRPAFWSTFTVSENLVIGFAPSDTDSTATYVYSFGEVSSFSGRLPLKPAFSTHASALPVYIYTSRSFELVPPFKVGEFIPLVLYGSYWYDKNCNGHRFCGERLIKPDLTSEILKNIPHYYVLGIQVKE